MRIKQVPGCSSAARRVCSFLTGQLRLLLRRQLRRGAAFARQAALARALADVAHRLVEVAVLAVRRVALHGVDDQLIHLRRHHVGGVPRIKRRGCLRGDLVNGRARVKRRLHLGRVLRQRQAGKCPGGRERLPGIDDFGRRFMCLCDGFTHNCCLPNASKAEPFAPARRRLHTKANVSARTGETGFSRSQRHWQNAPMPGNRQRGQRRIQRA